MHIREPLCRLVQHGEPVSPLHHRLPSVPKPLVQRAAFAVLKHEAASWTILADGIQAIEVRVPNTAEELDLGLVLGLYGKWEDKLKIWTWTSHNAAHQPTHLFVVPL